MQNPGIGTSTTVTGTISTKTPLTGLAPATASVGTSSSTVVSSNSSRKGLVIINLSNNIVSFATASNPAVLNSGITLVQYGVWCMDEYNYTTAAINAIASGASSTISIQEFV